MFKINPSSEEAFSRRIFCLSSLAVALFGISAKPSTSSYEPLDIKSLDLKIQTVDKNNFFWTLDQIATQIKADINLSEADKAERFANFANQLAKKTIRIFPRNQRLQYDALSAIEYYAEKLQLAKYNYFFSQQLVYHYLPYYPLEAIAKGYNFDLSKFEILTKADKHSTILATEIEPLVQIVKDFDIADKLEGLSFGVYTLNRDDVLCSATIEPKINAMLINLKYIPSNNFLDVDESMKLNISNEAIHLFLRHVFGERFNEQVMSKNQIIKVKVGNETIKLKELIEAEEFLSDAASIIGMPSVILEIARRVDQDAHKRYVPSMKIARAVISQLPIEAAQYLDCRYQGPLPDKPFNSLISEEVKEKIKSEYLRLAKEVLAEIIQIKAKQINKLKKPGFIAF